MFQWKKKEKKYLNINTKINGIVIVSDDEDSI